MSPFNRAHNLLTFRSKHRPISYRFRDRPRFQTKIAKFSHLCILCLHWRVPLGIWYQGWGPKTRMMGLPGRERSLTISSVVWIECSNVTDRRMDGQTDTGPQRRTVIKPANPGSPGKMAVKTERCSLSVVLWWFYSRVFNWKSINVLMRAMMVCLIVCRMLEEILASRLMVKKAMKDYKDDAVCITRVLHWNCCSQLIIIRWTAAMQCWVFSCVSHLEQL